MATCADAYESEGRLFESAWALAATGYLRCSAVPREPVPGQRPESVENLSRRARPCRSLTLARAGHPSQWVFTVRAGRQRPPGEPAVAAISVRSEERRSGSRRWGHGGGPGRTGPVRVLGGSPGLFRVV